jgi:ABC-type sugar transport system substrate-binding protein
MKKATAIILAALLVFSMFAGCANSSEATTSNPPSEAVTETSQEPTEPTVNEEIYKIGVISLGDSSTAFGRAELAAQNTIAAAAGFELVRIQLGGYDDESFVTAYESMINQGVDAAVVFTLSETVLPILKDMFEESNTKFFLFNRELTSTEMEDMMFSSPMCLGNDHANETQNAYDMVKQLKDTYDVKNMAVIGLTQGDINGDFRDAGIEQACADLGINLLSETRGIITTEDITRSVEGFIASYPELDSIFIVGGTVTTGALAGVNQALVNHNLQDKVVIGMVDISTGMVEYMDEGPLKLVAGGNLLQDCIFSLVATINALKGTPLSDMPVFDINMLWITNGEDAANYDKFIEGEVTPFSEEEYQTLMFKWLNPDVTFESVQALASDFTIASVMERNADKVS